MFREGKMAGSSKSITIPTACNYSGGRHLGRLCVFPTTQAAALHLALLLVGMGILLSVMATMLQL